MGRTSTEVCESEQSVLMICPREARGSRITKALYQDYITVVRAIATALDRPRLAGVPTAVKVETELVGREGRFFGKGGKIERAMDYVLHAAMEQSSRGDGTWDDIQRETAAATDPDTVAYAAIPTRDNDLAFADVAERLALGIVGRSRKSEGLDGELDDVLGDDVMEQPDNEDNDYVDIKAGGSEDW